MIKRILLSLFFLGVGIFSSWGYDFTQTEDGQTLYYTITSAVEPYTVKVTFPNSSAAYSSAAYSGFSKPSGAITIPTTVTNVATTYTVTAIDKWAFYACNEITSVVIPNTVTSIGLSVSTNGASFSNCKNLESINIPNSVTSIGYQSFSGCSKLGSITIPNSVSTIGESAFSGCSALQSLTIPSNVTTISKLAFQNCTGIESITFSSGATGISTLDRDTFAGCTNLTEVNFSNTNLTTIKAGAFANCTSLETITIPATVTSIEVTTSSTATSSYNPFNGCTYLTEIIVEEGNTKYSSEGANCIIEIKNSKKNIIVGCKGTIIPNDIKIIANYSFYGCDGLETITIPTGVTSIDSHAFENCTSLNGITIPSTVTSLGTNIFQNCTSLENVIINSTPNSIPNYTFSGCSSLTSCTIPSSVISIGSYAFSGCNSLTSFTIPSSVTTIGSSAYQNCTGLTTITIPSTVTSIGASAFYISTLTTVYMMKTTAPTLSGSEPFKKGYKDYPNIYVLYSSNHSILTSYKPGSGNWNTYNDKVSEIPNNYRYIDDAWLSETGGTPSSTSYVTIEDDLTLTSNLTIANLVINGGVLTIPSNYKVEVSGSTTCNNPANLVINDGGQLICNNAVQATVKKNVYAATYWGTSGSYTSDGWYFIASPVDDAAFPTGSYDNQDIYQLDWANNIWLNLQNSGNSELLSAGFQRGTGYLYASKDGNTINVAGEIQPLSGSDNATVTLATTGWNLIGNPLTCAVTVDKDFSELNGGSAVTNQTSGSTINPFQGIAVYGDAGTTVTFTKADSQNAVAPSNNSSLQMTLSQTVATRGAASSKVVDNAIVNFNGGSDMPKFKMLEGNANIFIPQNGEDYAIASSNHQGEMPLNFKANEVGTYTISFSGEVNGAYLIDMIDKQEVNLSANPSYTFIGSPADRSERFKIVFRNTSNDIFAYQNGSDIVVTGEGELQIFDVMGRIVSKQYVNGVGTWRAASVQNGVYILKLNGMTQKIVVR